MIMCAILPIPKTWQIGDMRALFIAGMRILTIKTVSFAFGRRMLYRVGMVNSIYITV